MKKNSFVAEVTFKQKGMEYLRIILHRFTTFYFTFWIYTR